MEVLACPLCGSTAVTPLGVLGRLVHLRCRDCGTTYHDDIDSPTTTTIGGGLVSERHVHGNTITTCDVCDATIEGDDYHTQGEDYHFHDECCPICQLDDDASWDLIQEHDEERVARLVWEARWNHQNKCSNGCDCPHEGDDDEL